MGHPCKPHGAFAKDPNEDYSEYGDDVHMNDALFVKGYRDLFELWKAAGAVVTDRFDVLYAAGISNQGLCYYRDRSLPATVDVLAVDGSTVAVEYDLLWWVHETVEWAEAVIMGRHKDVLIGQIALRDPSSPYTVGPVSRIHYRVAHQLAEAAEERLAQAMGLDVDDYVRACDEMIKQAGDAELSVSPRDLDLYPYEDECDMDALQAIADSGGPASYLLYETGVQGGSDGRPFYE